MASKNYKKVLASVVDLFCGVGGLSHGFFLENFSIAAGVDIDHSARYPFETNNKSRFLHKDVGKLTHVELDRLFVPELPRVLVGCAPCQPFSSYNKKNTDPKWKLLDTFVELIDRSRPEIVSMENVPHLERFRGGQLFERFLRRLEDAEYEISVGTLFGPDFGLPQTRSRLVVLASRLGSINLPKPSHRTHEYLTVSDAIGKLPPLDAGQSDSEDPMHQCSRLSGLNLRRIQASKPGGTWRDWPPELLAECHIQETGKGYGAVYGRMSWSKPSPTITTQFFGFGNGRFGHPDQDRGLSLREGAILQGFPKGYEFVEPTEKIEFKKMGRLIGNAVPVNLARAIARTIKQHIAQHQGAELPAAST